MRFLHLMTLLVIPAAASAEDAVLQPGEYEVQMRLELPHVEDMGVQKTAKVCITGGDTHGIVVLSENNPLARCPASNVKLLDQTLSFDLVCEGHNQAVAWAKFQLWPDRFSGVFDMKMGGKNMTMSERQTGKRVGVCKDPPHS
ncbi:hypothetical protein DLM45_05020 [Hyphomicrobium methylovorum]|uniref:DUF3617 domain-containing protein n=1 Tax=Hyphomicrobium methylovorum TaxID=84 RepID=UPI0015E65605|nr:DUF3617 family protein [Hyphomicrobium methylovorum]MBA2125586.1 hypothetical protein [Hyphomicrobium methylovorum]